MRVMPHAGTAAASAHLAEIRRQVTPGAHALPVLDGAGGHSANSLVVPENVTLMPLPPHRPEPNPVETLWQYLRQSHRANRVLDSLDAIVDVCRTAWNALIAPIALITMPQRRASITLREGARGGGLCRRNEFCMRSTGVA
jgi:hypothetical protein